MDAICEGVAIPDLAILIRVTPLLGLCGDDLLAADDERDMEIGDGLNAFECFTQPRAILTVSEISIVLVLELLQEVIRVRLLQSQGARRDGGAIVDCVLEATTLILELCTLGSDGERGAEIVLFGGVLIESSHEIGDGTRKVRSLRHRRVEEYRSKTLCDREGLPVRHPFEHLDIDHLGKIARSRKVGRPDDVEEIVACDTEADSSAILGAQPLIDQSQVTGIDVGLGEIGRLGMAVVLRFRTLHCEVRTLDEADLHAATTPCVTFSAPLDQTMEVGMGVGKVGLDDDAGIERFEFRFIE